MKRVLGFIFLLFSIFGFTSCNIVEENIESETENNENEVPNEENKEIPNEDSTKEETDDKVYLSFSDSYYQVLNGELDKSFKMKLHNLVETTHIHKLSYSGVWDALKKADQDPNNSDNVLCIYTRQSIPIANQDKGTSGNNIWNREHLWPKAKGFKSQSIPAHNDCHHLHASEKNINNYRGNLDFGEVENPKKSDEYGNKWDSIYFEPMDCVKGDIARSLFYMVIRYDGDVCNNCELDLELVNGVGTENTSGVTGRLGDLQTLLKWHYEDPVDDLERNRNNVVYSIQGNRNPFIDHEEFVAYLYTEYVKEYTNIDKFAYLMEE